MLNTALLSRRPLRNSVPTAFIIRSFHFITDMADVEASKRRKGKAPAAHRHNKGSLMDIAASTLDKIKQGSYDVEGDFYNLAKSVAEMNKNTVFYAADSELAGWPKRPDNGGDSDAPAAHITVSECSTLTGAQTLRDVLKAEDVAEKRIGVLNFASAKNPGGGFLTGAQAQEESIARSSTLYPSLMTDTAQRFYQSHRKDPKEGYYSHAMIYSPHVLFIRADNGDWHEPVETEVLTSCAVNAGVVRRYLRESRSEDESNLDAAMRERMGRVLYLFEKQGVRNLVLGSFGTGVFRNRVELVAEVWKELLVGNNARFQHSFDRVVFAIIDNATYRTFEQIFSVGKEGVGHN